MVAILEHLIVRKCKALARHFHELPFVPRDRPELQRITHHIDREVGEQDFAGRLRGLLRVFSCNTDKQMQVLVLRQVRDMVRLRWEELRPLVGAGEGELVDPVVGELVAALMPVRPLSRLGLL